MSADAVLRLFWWFALGLTVATIGIMLVGELGLALLLRYLARNETERRALLSHGGWAGIGHPAWLLLAGGAVVGAWWPLFHATLFSGLWLVLLAIAVALLIGPLAHGARARLAARYRSGWDGLWFLIALAALLVMGIGVGVTVSGVPLGFDAHMNAHWGSFTARFSVYDVLVPGLLAITMAVILGTARAATGAPDEIVERARLLLLPAGIIALLLFIGGAIWATQLPGYAVGGLPPASGNTVFATAGAYLERFLFHLPLLVIPILTGLSLIGVIIRAWQGVAAGAWRFAAFAVAGMVASAGAMTYPVIVPSWSAPAQSLTLWNAASGRAILISLLVWLGVLVPAVAAYELWLRWRAQRETANWSEDVAG